MFRFEQQDTVEDDEGRTAYGWVIGPRAHLELSTLLAEYYDAAARPATLLPQVLYY